MTEDTKEYKNHTIDIAIDENPESPRKRNNICFFHVIHKRYAFGDKNYSSMEEYNQEIKQARRNKDIILPLYMIDHSGVSISLTQFACSWDSGQVGAVVIPRQKMLKEFGKKIFTASLKNKALEIAKMEVDALNKYLNGYVYGFIIDGDGESVWGYYDIEQAMEDAKISIDNMGEEPQAKPRMYIKHNVILTM